ncbi:MAG: TRAP transporter large permease subunit [Limnobacter sp.]|uniref:TRAP transporter large permease n=1 Tax=Limnobacter sp. TaxID=2003368 RepID=UPI003918E5B8
MALNDLLAPLMFITLIVFMLSGFPVAFAQAANGLLFGYVAIELGMMQPALLQALPERLFGIMSNDTLLAIPFFTFMGVLLEKSGMAEELLEAVGSLFGRIRGGLAYAVILVGALLAATTGVVAASVISMGLISLPIMLKNGYSPRIASGTIVASGTLAQIIPPSLVLIVLADQLKVSVGDMYTGALLPSAILVGFFVAYIAVVSVLDKNALPALPKRDLGASMVSVVVQALKSMLPPLVLIGLVLGGIFTGVATSTEAGALGATGALVLTALKKRLSMPLLKDALDNSTKLSCFVMFILIGSTVFGLTFRAIEGDIWIEHGASHLPGGELGFILAVQLLIFVLGCFIDFFEIVFIVVPLLMPIADKLGIDLVWFGVMIGMNLQTSFLTPPFGFSLFYLKSVAPPSLKVADIYRGVVPFIVLQILAVVLIYFFPGLLMQDKKISKTDTPLILENPAGDYGSPYGNPDAPVGAVPQPMAPRFSEP